jgi:hypothetical protein
MNSNRVRANKMTGSNILVQRKRNACFHRLPLIKQWKTLQLIWVPIFHIPLPHNHSNPVKWEILKFGKRFLRYFSGTPNRVLHKNEIIQVPV